MRASLLAICLMVFALLGCASHEPTQGSSLDSDVKVHKEAKKQFITIKEPDVIWEYGKVKFKVYPNDILEVVQVKTCRGGSGVCLKVIKLETGEYGYVSLKEMKERHELYTRE